MKCKNCGKEISIYLPKPFCNIDCEKKYKDTQKDDNVENFMKIFGMK